MNLKSIPAWGWVIIAVLAYLALVHFNVIKGFGSTTTPATNTSNTTNP